MKQKLPARSHIRIKAEDTERWLLDQIDRRIAHHVYPLDTDPVLLALRLQQHQLQDDHYDNLLNRDDFLRQSSRLRQRVADRRRELTNGYPRALNTDCPVTATLEDPEPVRRAALRAHPERVYVDPHPRGVAARQDNWERRRIVVGRRLRPVWIVTPGQEPCETELPAGDEARATWTVPA